MDVAQSREKGSADWKYRGKELLLRAFASLGTVTGIIAPTCQETDVHVNLSLWRDENAVRISIQMKYRVPVTSQVQGRDGKRT